MNCTSAIQWATKYLGKHGIENARGTGEDLLSFTLNCNKVDLYADPKLLNDREFERFTDLVYKRKDGRPAQYLRGSVSFMGLELLVNEGTLIPRPETEILVEQILKLAEADARARSILDIGTGCGNIAISLAKFLPQSSIMACDISSAALGSAATNAKMRGVADKIKFVKSDLFSNVPASSSFDIIVSNPPYVREGELSWLSREVGHEPEIALNGGRDGLDFYTRIAKDASYFLKDAGYLALEVGYDQAGDVGRILRAAGFNDVSRIKDYSGVERIVIARHG